MIRTGTFRCLLAAFAVALAAGSRPAPLSAQASDREQARSGPLIIVNGVVLQGGTAAEQESVLKIIGPAIESFEVLKGAAAVQRFGDAASDGVILVRLKSDFTRGRAAVAESAPRDVVTIAPVDEQSRLPLMFIDGVVVPATIMRALGKQDIERIEVIKGPAALAQFGEPGRAGVIHITTRRRQPQ
jgi:hypothetical protein